MKRRRDSARNRTDGRKKPASPPMFRPETADTLSREVAGNGFGVRLGRDVAMRAFRFFLTAAIVGTALLAAPWNVSSVQAELFDEECRGACKDAVKTCARAAKIAFRSCKEDCRDAVDRRECRRACRPALREAKDTCKAAREDCRQACEEEPPPPEECSHCRAELRVCLHEVGQAGRSCGSDCFESKSAAARECRNSPHPLSCFIELARNTASCLQGCASEMRSGLHGCEIDHGLCRRECEGPGPYGSASQAFLITSDSLF